MKVTIIADFRTKSRNYSVLRKANKRRPNKQVRLIAEASTQSVGNHDDRIQCH